MAAHFDDDSIISSAVYLY